MPFKVQSNVMLSILLLSAFGSQTSQAQSLRSDFPGVKKDSWEQSASQAKRFSQPFRPAVRGNFEQSPAPLKLGGFDELVPFVLASPDQGDAGSCLYMSITGIAEWWLAKLNPGVSRSSEGPLDLSERYVMNMAGIEENETGLENWRTDAIYLFNRGGQKSVLNSAYRFTKGWFTGTVSDENQVPAEPNAKNATYGEDFNWINQLEKVESGFVDLPEFEREVLFEDPAKNQWNIGVAPENIVEKVKSALTSRKAPVQVIYNQNGYWHSVFIVGFNDEMDTQNCAYTQRFRKRIQERAEEFERLAREAKTPGEIEYYQTRALRAKEAKSKIEGTYARGGGCVSQKGSFYIRDSIYADENGPTYDYDLSQKGEESPYAHRIVFKEYDWLRYFANNVSQIYVK
jgi:hypothetical protein